ncbi:MAG: hypothetical protein GC178_14495 [Flavobacteriales bacterium]|nr:hypothetical protein [Flavobacteriales bacterium]
MRNELNNIERIEKYLMGDMSATEKTAFENEMNSNAELKEQVELQRDLMEGITRKSLVQDAQKAHKKYKLGKGGLNWGLGGFAVLVVAAAAWFLAPKFSSETSENLRYPTNEIGTEQFADADKFLPSQLFEVDGGKDTVIQTEGGITMTILANTFLDEDGHPVKGSIDLEVKEALDPLSIMKAGLTTLSGDQLLESGGMFYVNGRQGNTSLQIDPNQGIYTQVPTDRKDANMQLYDGKRLADGRIDWVNPKPLETFLTPVDITTLNFYPPDYLDELENRGHDRADKRFTDSLYYSYASYFEHGTAQSITESGWTTDKITKNLGYFGKETSLITWKLSFSPKGIGNWNNPQLVLRAKIADGWKLAFFEQGEDSPLIIDFVENSNYRTILDLRYSENIKSYNVAGKDVFAFTNDATFWQEIELNEAACNLEVSVKFTLFNEGATLPPFAGNLKISNLGCDQSYAEEDVLKGINPASIKTIWNEKFNNTNLATEEFEERLAHIHGTCDQWILDYYVNNLDKRLCTLDSAVAQKRGSMHIGYSGVEYYADDTIGVTSVELPAEDKFWEFARRGDGRVETDNKYAEFLKGYYHRQAKMEAEAIQLVRKQYDEENLKKLREAQEQRNSHTSAEAERYLRNWSEEFQTNLKEAYRQLGYKPTTVRPRNNAIVTTPGWKNVDQAVAESTTNRTTLDYTDKNGKRAVIKYEPISLEIANAAEFDRVLVYMLPDNLYSFQRMTQNGNRYSEKLNELFAYDVMCIGFKGEESFIHHIKKAKPKDYGSVTLEYIPETELEKLLYRVKDYSVQRNLKEDLAYQKFDIKEQKRVKKLMAREQLRNEMYAVVFPCSPQMFYENSEEAMSLIESE